MKKSMLLIMIGAIAALVSFEVSAQQIIKENAYQLSLPAGWEQTKQVPQGLDVKAGNQGQRTFSCPPQKDCHAPFRRSQ